MSGDKVIPVKVALRIRPLVPREKEDGCTECLRTITGAPQVILGKDKAFTYDYVFSQKTPQVEVYETSVQPLLSALFKGYNATVLAYGQTGSGKTYSMGSGYATLTAATAQMNSSDAMMIDSADFDDVGVIPRVLNDLFRNIEDEQRQNKEYKFSVRVSFVEIYNEEIKDLLNLKLNSGVPAEPLNIREENNTIRVVGLSEVAVSNAITTIQLLERGSSFRAVGGTAMNEQSSRSHAIFTISLEQQRGGENELIKSKFHLVDLAGSERQSKTKAEGMRLKEGININLGLLALGNVISVLGEDNPSNKQRHVPYRESKLTRLLQDSLGGNSHTVMIACVSPADSNMEETLNTLRYADRARKIKNKPIVNIDPQAAELSNLKQQVQELKAHIYHLTGGTPHNFNYMESSTEMATLKEENERLKSENQKLLSELQRLININRVTYDRLTMLETERDEQTKKFNEIKSTFEGIVSQAAKDKENTSPEEACGEEASKANMLIDQLKAKFGEFEQQLKEKEQPEFASSEELTLESEPADKEFALRQAKMQVQLSEYDSELMKKEMLHRKMLESLFNTNKDTNMDELKGRIELLEKEKEELMELVRSSDARKLPDQKRDRLRQLENEVSELRRREKETQRMAKLKEENEKHCEKLCMEIQHIKQERVKLIKQMKSDTDHFRKYKQEKEKEVNQLKALERKRQVEITKLQEGHNRQEAVLRRKNEEINRIQRQLRDTLEKQKQVAEKRQQTFDRKESSLGEKMRTWVTQELELSVNLAEARINLNKLIEERKESAAELTRLTDKLSKEFAGMDEASSLMPPPPAPAPKRRFLGGDMDTTYVAYPAESGPSDSEFESRSQLEQKIEQLKEDIECKTIQINDIQQMVIEGDQDDRTKYLFNNVHGLLEAKVLLKHLYNTGVQYLLDLKLKQVQFDNSTAGMSQELKDLKKKLEVSEEELAKLQKETKEEINQLHQHYQQRIILLCKSGVSLPTCNNDDRFKILFEQFQLLQKRLDPNESHADSKSFEMRDLTNAKDPEAKRSQKLKREQRRTRIIRTGVDENMSLKNEPIEEALSPAPSSPFDVIATPDDKVNDPDWVKTPLRVKRAKPGLLPRKRISRSQLLKSSMEPFDENLDQLHQ